MQKNNLTRFFENFIFDKYVENNQNRRKEEEKKTKGKTSRKDERPTEEYTIFHIWETSSVNSDIIQFLYTFYTKRKKEKNYA